MTKLATAHIAPKIVVTESPYFPGVEVISIPGLGYYASRESAQEALDQLVRGECPNQHTAKRRTNGVKTSPCRVCGELQVAV